MLPTIEWKDDAVVMIDQRKLPASEIYVSCKTAQEVARAIKTMVIRQRAGVAVRQDARLLGHQLRPERAHRPAARDVFVVDAPRVGFETRPFLQGARLTA